MPTPLPIKLAKLRKKIEALSAEVVKENATLVALPGKLGYASIPALIHALRRAQKSSPAPMSATARKPRTKVTKAIIANLSKMVAANKAGREIADALKISAATVANVKRKLGLVRRRKASK